MRVEPLLERLLTETPTSRAPDRLRADIACATSRKRQRPPWLTSLKEPPMRYRSQLVVGSPTLRLAAVVAVTAVLTLALAGAVIAGASPAPSPVPPVAPTWVTGDIQPVDGTCSSRDNGSDSGVGRSAWTCTQTSTSSDPRLTGTVTKSWNEDTYQMDEGPISVGIDTLYLRNDDGGWSCSSGYVAKGSTPETEPLTKSTFTCIGEGGYEGLTAVLVSEQVAGAYDGEFAGLIFPGDLPAVPEAPAAQ